MAMSPKKRLDHKVAQVQALSQKGVLACLKAPDGVMMALV